MLRVFTNRAARRRSHDVALDAPSIRQQARRAPPASEPSASDGGLASLLRENDLRTSMCARRYVSNALSSLHSVSSTGWSSGMFTASPPFLIHLRLPVLPQPTFVLGFPSWRAHVGSHVLACDGAQFTAYTSTPRAPAMRRPYLRIVATGTAGRVPQLGRERIDSDSEASCYPLETHHHYLAQSRDFAQPSTTDRVPFTQDLSAP